MDAGSKVISSGSLTDTIKLQVQPPHAPRPSLIAAPVCYDLGGLFFSFLSSLTFSSCVLLHGLFMEVSTRLSTDLAD